MALLLAQLFNYILVYLKEIRKQQKDTNQYFLNKFKMHIKTWLHALKTNC